MPTDDHVKVGVRIKPCNGPSSCEGDTLHNKVVLARSTHGAARRYTFDHVFDEQATNAELYESIGAPLLRSALDGYNATLLAYGQTGAGKTHTIMGQGQEDPGVVMRLVSQLFDAASQQGKHVQFSMLEIYNERIRDLFSVRRSTSESLRIREDPTTGPFVENLSWFVAEDREAMQELLSIGAEARTVRSTHNNQHSSRAHTVVQIAITALQAGGRPANTGSSMICLVDLAGSERHDATGTVASVGPKTLREGCSINKSLTNLGLCISALVAAGPGDVGRGQNQSPRRLAALGLSPGALRPGGYQRQTSGKSHIPYRNSALTWLLRESIGGNSKTAILACVNPEPRHREESLSTLRFADRAKQLTTRVDRNVNMKPGTSRTARRDRILREHGMFAVSSDAQATIDALREEVRRLESTLQAHSADSGQAGATCLIPGGMITTVNGQRVASNFGSVDRPAAFKHGDRVTVWDPASQQEHAFLHLKSTEAPKQQLDDERKDHLPDSVANPQKVRSEESAQTDTEYASSKLDANNSFLEAEEMAYNSRSRRLSLDSSISLMRDKSTLDLAEEHFVLEASRKVPPASKTEVDDPNDYTDVLHRRKTRHRQRSRIALKTSTQTTCDSRKTASLARQDARRMSSYNHLLKRTSSWAPCAVFILGCGAAALLPSEVQDDLTELAQGQYSPEATEGLQVQQSLPPMVRAISVSIDWVPSIIGIIGWTVLVYMIVGRWRRWIAAQPASDSRQLRKTERFKDPRVASQSATRPGKAEQGRCQWQHDAGKFSAGNKSASHRQRGQHQDTGCVMDASRAHDRNRRHGARQQKDRVHRRLKSVPVETQVHGQDFMSAERQQQKQQRMPGKLTVDSNSNDGARLHTIRNHSTKRKLASNRHDAKPLQDKTNTAFQDYGDTRSQQSAKAHCDRHRQGHREHLEDINQHRQRAVESQHRKAMAYNHEKPSRNAEAWKQQCCDTLAV